MLENRETEIRVLWKYQSHLAVLRYFHLILFPDSFCSKKMSTSGYC